jgi:hypothetical protein
VGVKRDNAGYWDIVLHPAPSFHARPCFLLLQVLADPSLSLSRLISLPVRYQEMR